MGKESMWWPQGCMMAVDHGWVVSRRFHGAMHARCACEHNECTLPLPIKPCELIVITQPHQCNCQLYCILLYMTIATISPMACVSSTADAPSSSQSPSST